MQPFRRLAVGVLATIALIAASVSVPMAASADAGLISGTITTDGAPLDTTLYFEIDSLQLVNGSDAWVATGLGGGANALHDSFAFANQPAGTYRAVFYGDNVSYDAWTSDPVDWDALETLDFSHQFHSYPLYQITGNVSPVTENVTVEPFEDSSGPGLWRQAGYASLDGSGTYQVSVRAGRSYLLRFRPENGSQYKTQVYPGIDWSGNIGDAVGAQLISEGDTAGKSAVLNAGGGISGTITATTPLSATYPEYVVLLTPGTLAEVKRVATASRDYSMSGVLNGDYLVRFETGEKAGNVNARRKVQYYDGVDTSDAATTVHVDNGTVTTDIDASLTDLPEPLSVNGTVSLDPASTSTAITVTLQKLVGSDWTLVHAGQTSPSGTYTDSIAPGSESYRYVYSATGYVSQTSASFTPNVGPWPSWDVTLVAVPLEISGTVTLDPASSSTAITVTLQKFDGSNWNVVTTSNGFYSAVLEGSETYRYVYSATGYVSQISASFVPKIGPWPGWNVTLAAVPIRVTGGGNVPLLTFTSTPIPKIIGTAKFGKKLTVKLGSWKPSGAKFSYQWFAGSSKIKKATKSTFKLTKAQKGKRVSVRVTASKSGYTTVVRTSKVTKKVASA